MNEPRRRVGRPRKDDFQKANVLTTANKRGDDIGVPLDLSDVIAGVSISWLAATFSMGTNTVKKLLADCPRLQKNQNGDYYDLKVAAQYLVKPKVDIAKFIKTMNPRDMPPDLQKEYWDGQLKRLDYMQRSAQLWSTDKVLDVLATAFKTLKSTIQLWSETIERAHGLTESQRKTLIECSDALLEELHTALIALPSAQRTGPIKDDHGAVDEQTTPGSLADEFV